MKKIGIIMMFVASMAFVSCKSTQTAATPGAQEGIKCAKALTQLNKSRKANGTISLTNTADLANMLVIFNSYTDLRNHKEDDIYKGQFISGLVRGGFSEVNALSIVNTLLGSNAFANINTANLAQKAETVTTIIQLLSLINSNNQ
ncbi:MAG: hypothetical protein MJZ81_10970 [Bacteroidales bacterium]|nr:hypothetical protein [Bacteroidales bacterium]